MVSIIICSVNLVKFRAVTALYQRLFGDDEHEIIGIHDAKSLCEGYNRGLQQSKGDLLIFCHDDIEILEPNFASLLEKYLGEYDVVGVAGTQRLIHPIWTAAGWPYLAGQIAHPGKQQYEGGWVINVYRAGHPVIGDIQVLDGLFIAARRDAAVQVGWDSTTFDGFHFYDIDFSFRAFLQGYKLAVANTFAIIHGSEGRANPAEYQKYGSLFAAKHQRNIRAAPPHLIQETKVLARTKEEVLEIMKAGII